MSEQPHLAGSLPAHTVKLLEDYHTQRLGSHALQPQSVLALFSPEQSNYGKRAAILGGTSLFGFVCQLLMPTKTKKMDLYEEEPVHELSGGADGPEAMLGACTVFCFLSV